MEQLQGLHVKRVKSMESLCEDTFYLVEMVIDKGEQPFYGLIYTGLKEEPGGKVINEPAFISKNPRKFAQQTEPFSTRVIMEIPLDDSCSLSDSAREMANLFIGLGDRILRSEFAAAQLSLQEESPRKEATAQQGDIDGCLDRDWVRLRLQATVARPEMAEVLDKVLRQTTH